jgi:hypothetical protein
MADLLNPLLHTYKQRSINSECLISIAIIVSKKNVGQNFLSEFENFRPEVNFGKTKVSLASAFDMRYFLNMLTESTQPSLRNHSIKSENRQFLKVLPVQTGSDG